MECVGIGKAAVAGRIPGERAITQTPVLRVEPHQPERPTQEFAQPPRGFVALVVCDAVVLPHDDVARLTAERERHLRRTVSRGGQAQPRVVDVRLDQREPRFLALRDEPAIRGHHHPFTVMLEARFRNDGARALDAAT